MESLNSILKRIRAGSRAAAADPTAPPGRPPAAPAGANNPATAAAAAAADPAKADTLEAAEAALFGPLPAPAAAPTARPTEPAPAIESPAAAPEPIPPSCPACQGARWVTKAVPVGHPEFGAAFPCPECRGLRAANQPAAQAAAQARRQERSGLGPLTAVTFPRLNPQGPDPEPLAQCFYAAAYQAAAEFRQQPQGALTLAGPGGSGKTWLLAALANAALEQGQAVHYATVPELLEALRPGSFDRSGGGSSNSSNNAGLSSLGEGSPGNEYSARPAGPEAQRARLRSQPLLALDDLNPRILTPWGQEQLCQLLNDRQIRELPTLLALQGPPERLDDRLRRQLDAPAQGRRILPLAPGISAAAQRLGGMSPQLRQKTLAAFQPSGGAGLTPEQRRSLEQAWQSAREFAENPQGWLALIGPRGCGKTHLLAGIALGRSARGQPALRAFVPDLLDYLRAAYAPRSPDNHEELFAEIKNAPLLLLDDLSLVDATAWAKNKLDQLLIYRSDQGLPLVLTSVYSPEELHEESPALSSRLLDDSLTNLRLITAPNYRRAGDPPSSMPTSAPTANLELDPAAAAAPSRPGTRSKYPPPPAPQLVDEPR